jgi:hypothetical protein
MTPAQVHLSPERSEWARSEGYCTSMSESSRVSPRATDPNTRTLLPPNDSTVPMIVFRCERNYTFTPILSLARSVAAVRSAP